jgi:hypothetical protein
MSMKRTKQRSSGTSKDLDNDPWAKKPEPEKSWQEQVDGKPDDAFAAYALSTTYTKGQLVAHAKFGKGVIVGVEGNRVEILFQEGKKKLGHATAGT